MALTLQEIRGLETQGKYREVIEGVGSLRDTPDDSNDERVQLVLARAWAHYQLGEYGEAENWGKSIASWPAFFPPATTEVGESAWRLLAHCAERRGDLDQAEVLLRELPTSTARDNLWVTILVKRQRNGEVIEASRAVELVLAAQSRAPYQVVDGHIINNVTWLLHGARDQKDVKPFLPLLSGLIEIAIGIYEVTGAAPNHLAGALYRASLIF